MSVFPPNTAPIVPPAWANNTIGPRAHVSVDDYRAAPACYVVGSVHWQGWIDCNDNSVIEYLFNCFELDQDIGVVAAGQNDLYYAMIRLGLMAYAKEA
jgi:hypothetical protein